jgi:hypothetical protein
VLAAIVLAAVLAVIAVAPVVVVARVVAVIVCAVTSVGPVGAPVGGSGELLGSESAPRTDCVAGTAPHSTCRSREGCR